MWRAIRHGLDGELIDLERAEEQPAAEAVERLLAWTAPVRGELGIEVALPELNGAQRQRRLLEAGALDRGRLRRDRPRNPRDLRPGGDRMSAQDAGGRRPAASRPRRRCAPRWRRSSSACASSRSSPRRPSRSSTSRVLRAGLVPGHRGRARPRPDAHGDRGRARAAAARRAGARRRAGETDPRRAVAAADGVRAGGGRSPPLTVRTRRPAPEQQPREQPPEGPGPAQRSGRLWVPGQ